MTHEESRCVQAARPDLPLVFHPHLDRQFVYLEGRPCPLLGTDPSGQATCTVHAVRPYNCRRFGCFRPDITTEPYEAEALDLDRGRLGCANLSDRLLNRSVRRAYAQLQRKAQRWARQHGWRDAVLPESVGSSVIVYRLARRPR